MFIDTEAATNIAAVSETVTNSIIAELERGAAPWGKPWKDGKRVGMMAANAISGRHYRDINVPILWRAADAHCFSTNAWLTFKQALDVGGHVEKGEKGAQIVFTKRVGVKDDDDDDRQISMLRAFTVFNVAQVEGVEALHAITETPPSGAVAVAFPVDAAARSVLAPILATSNLRDHSAGLCNRRQNPDPVFVAPPSASLHARNQCHPTHAVQLASLIKPT